MMPDAVWAVLLAAFAPVFTEPSFTLFSNIATAWALCPGRRAITRIYLLAEPSRERAHDAYHRFFREGAWDMDALWELLARFLVSRFYPQGAIPLDLDDTLFHKSGRKVEGAAWWRDAVASTGSKVVHALGMNLVVLTLRIRPPWGGEPLGLPVLVRLHTKGGPGLMDIAEEMVRLFASWFPDRDTRVTADGFYSPLAGRKPPRSHLKSRMRRDAALYKLVPPRLKGQRGRPRKHGERLPTPEQLALHTRSWQPVDVEERGKIRKRLVTTFVVLWYGVCPDDPVRLVICRDPDSKEPDDFFFSTDVSDAPETVVSDYAGRWSIEDTFKNTKQYLGGQDPQLRTDIGPQRAAAFSFWLYSVIWVWYLQTYGTKRSWNPLPWYPAKRTPSFIDALASLRGVLWRQRVFSNSENQSLPSKIINSLIDTLAHAA